MNAEVTMPLSEIDNLRDNLKNALSRIKELESTEKKIKIEIREGYHAFKTDYRGSIPIVLPYTAIREHPHQYINMDDVIGVIRDEETAKVQNELHSKDKAIIDLRDQFNKLEIKSNENVKKLKEEYENKISLLKGKKVDEQNKKIDKEKSKIINSMIAEKLEQDTFINKVTNSFIGKIFFKKQIDKLYNSLYGQKETNI